jgi:hypothetical protein
VWSYGGRALSGNVQVRRKGEWRICTICKERSYVGEDAPSRGILPESRLAKKQSRVFCVPIVQLATTIRLL